MEGGSGIRSISANRALVLVACGVGLLGLTPALTHAQQTIQITDTNDDAYERGSSGAMTIGVVQGVRVVLHDHTQPTDAGFPLPGCALAASSERDQRRS